MVVLAKNTIDFLLLATSLFVAASYPGYQTFNPSPQTFPIHQRPLSSMITNSSRPTTLCISPSSSQIKLHHFILGNPLKNLLTLAQPTIPQPFFSFNLYFFLFNTHLTFYLSPIFMIPFFPISHFS